MTEVSPVEILKHLQNDLTEGQSLTNPEKSDSMDNNSCTQSPRFTSPNRADLVKQNSTTISDIKGYLRYVEKQDKTRPPMPKQSSTRSHIIFKSFTGNKSTQETMKKPKRTFFELFLVYFNIFLTIMIFLSIILAVVIVFDLKHIRLISSPYIDGSGVEIFQGNKNNV